MKAKWFILCMFALLVNTTANAVSINGICYTLNSTDKTATVTYYSTTSSFNSNYYSGDIHIPSSVTYSSKSYRVIAIGASAFEGCSGLTSIEIPNSVTSIGEDAFFDCSGLTSIEIPNSVTSIGEYAFYKCSGLTSIEIPNSVTSIDQGAFYKCSGLTSVEIPNSVTSIGSDVFYGCSGLTSIEIPNSVTSIGNSAFEDCSGLMSVAIPNSVTSIGIQAFIRCSNLTSVNISDLGSWCNISFGNAYANPLYYAHHLFLNGVEVADLVIPNSVTSIGSDVFYGCSGLTSVTIPNSVTSIGNSAFSLCSGLTSVTIPNSVTSIGNSVFYGCSGLTSIEIPNSVTSIGNNAFDRCFSLTSVTIGNSVTSIGIYAFYKCSGLTNVTIPNSVTSIGESAFEYCSGLTSVAIPNSVTSIGKYAFYNCSSLTSVKVDVVNPLSIDYQTFSNPNATLYVPVGSKVAYEAAVYWKQFKEIVEFINGDVNGDGESDVLDVVDIARYVVGTPAETFVPILADINDNGEVNIADAVCLVNDIAGDQNFAKPNRAPKHNAANETLLLTTDNENYLSLALQNERDYTAFQFDLYVPDGTDVTQMLLNAQRKQKHQLLYNKVEDGHWRVAALSTSNRTFNGNDGELLNITLDALTGEEIAMRNILFFDASGNSCRFNDIMMNGTTMIQSMDNGQLTMNNSSTVYDMQGRKIVNGKLSRGVYIVNGKKVMIK